MIEVGVAHGDETCEDCGRWFDPGDWTYGVVSAEYGPDPYGLDPAKSDYDLTSGRTVDHLLCEDCFTGVKEER